MAGSVFIDGEEDSGTRRSGASRIKAVDGLRRGVSIERRVDAVEGAVVRGRIFKGREAMERPCS